MTSPMEILERLATPERVARIDEVLANRTRGLVLVLENVHDPHNQAACIRSAEGLGLQEIHVAGVQGFSPNTAVVHGADKWVDLKVQRDPVLCIRKLKERGLAVAAAALTPAAVPISVLDFSKPIALAFGNEHDGLSKEFLSKCDTIFKVPMLGFTQSFNVSVSVAVSLHFAVSERIRLLGRNGDLAEPDRLVLREKWLRLSVPMADEVVEEMLRREKS